MTQTDAVYAFVFRGLLAEEALDVSGRTTPRIEGFHDDDIVAAVSLNVLDEGAVKAAKQMAAVYAAIAAFENSARRLVSARLLEEFGDGWWMTNVSESVRKFAKSRQESEEAIRWHAPRGENPINYIDFSHLVNIIRQNWPTFEPHFRSLEWVQQIFNVLERSRNVIMHSGVLEMADIERVGMNIRDWSAQVGG
jgi:hypothetical protein